MPVFSGPCVPTGKHPSVKLFNITLDSYEASLLLSLTTAVAVRSIAATCAAGLLRSCGCDARLTSPFKPFANYSWTRCNSDRGSHNLPFAKKITRYDGICSPEKLIDNQYRCTHPLLTRRVILHNIAIGRASVSLHYNCGSSFVTSRYSKNVCSAQASEWITVSRRLQNAFKRARELPRNNALDVTEECSSTKTEKSLKFITFYFTKSDLFTSVNYDTIICKCSTTSYTSSNSYKINSAFEGVQVGKHCTNLIFKILANYDTQDAMAQCADRMRFQQWDCSDAGNIMLDPPILKYGPVLEYEQVECSYGVQHGITVSRKLLTRSTISRSPLRKIEKHNLKAGRLVSSEKDVDIIICSSLNKCNTSIFRYARSCLFVNDAPVKNADLVYLEPSPDPCHKKGAEQRICAWRNETHAQGDCGKLCCGRGFKIILGILTLNDITEYQEESSFTCVKTVHFETVFIMSSRTTLYFITIKTLQRLIKEKSDAFLMLKIIFLETLETDIKIQQDLICQRLLKQKSRIRARMPYGNGAFNHNKTSSETERTSLTVPLQVGFQTIFPIKDRKMEKESRSKNRARSPVSYVKPTMS
uniref:Protein Wnt n=1 Tax=Heterorhabditis bacteriophora TaxID=37862 RepID=A0A1I7WPG0_HETBA